LAVAAYHSLRRHCHGDEEPLTLERTNELGREQRISASTIELFDQRGSDRCIQQRLGISDQSITIKWFEIEHNADGLDCRHKGLDLRGDRIQPARDKHQDTEPVCVQYVAQDDQRRAVRPLQIIDGQHHRHFAALVYQERHNRIVQDERRRPERVGRSFGVQHRADMGSPGIGSIGPEPKSGHNRGERPVTFMILSDGLRNTEPTCMRQGECFRDQPRLPDPGFALNQQCAALSVHKRLQLCLDDLALVFPAHERSHADPESPRCTHDTPTAPGHACACGNRRRRVEAPQESRIAGE